MQASAVCDADWEMLISPLSKCCPFLSSYFSDFALRNGSTGAENQPVLKQILEFLQLDYPGRKKCLQHCPAVLLCLKVLTNQCAFVEKSTAVCGNGLAFARLSSVAVNKIFGDVLSAKLSAPLYMKSHKRLLIDYIVSIILHGSGDQNLSFTLDFCMHEVLEAHRKMRAPWDIPYTELGTFDDTKHFLRMLQETQNAHARQKVRGLFYDIFVETRFECVETKAGNSEFTIPPGRGQLIQKRAKDAILTKPNAEVQRERYLFMRMLAVSIKRSNLRPRA